MGETFAARVIAAFGRHLLVRDLSGNEWKARPFGRSLAVVCGDRVRCAHDPRHGEIHVLEIMPRQSVLYRSNLRGGGEPVVANLSRLLIVLAPMPEPDLFVVDRYLAAAASAAIQASLIVNKVELGIDPELAVELEAYSRIGCSWVACSAHAGTGIAALAEVCSRATSALVGQSGVGKSSLVRCLLPAAEIEVGGLVRQEEGRHTTTAARAFELPGDGSLIDSPGVRDFAPAVEHLDERTLGFAELKSLAPQCRFLDCRHMREPGCAVRAAAESGGMHSRRYESYRRLRRLREDLLTARGPGRRR
jgi:ribosome biogenesis GTPase / thiamine phosphate phosphatase